MGLDITAYSRLKPVGKHTEGWCGDESHVEAYAYDCFPASFRGIPILGTAAGSGGDTFMVGGCYTVTGDTKIHRFRAGAYSGYGAWRDDLCRQFNPDTKPDLPFYELIFFADNEGTIGPEAALDLLADFDLHVNLYDPPEHIDYFREKYADWHEACRLAADSGLICFH